MLESLNVIETFALSMVVLFLGGLISAKVKVLRKYNIPEPVLGGLVFAILQMIIGYIFDFQIKIDDSMSDTMRLAFFTTIGLSASIKVLLKGGVKVLIFCVVATIFLLIQNTVGVLLAKTMGLDPLVGMLAGSMTLSGGHGTGATFALRFDHLEGAMEIAMASATVGLILGGVLGGPLSQHLIAKNRLAPDEKVRDAQEALKGHGFDEPELVTPKTMLEMLFVIAVCIVVGALLQKFVLSIGITLPDFVCTLFIGIIITNIFEVTHLYKVPQQTVDLLGVLSLSIFLTQTLMNLDIRHLTELAAPLIILLSVQVLVLWFYVTMVTYRVMGKDYESAVICSGHTGFGLGATPTAVANMESIVMRYGAAPRAFLTVTLVGSFFIDVINTLVIETFLKFL